MIIVKQKLRTEKGIVTKGTYNKLPEALVSDVNLKLYVIGGMINIGDTEIKYTEKQTAKHDRVVKVKNVEKKVAIITPDGVSTPKEKTVKNKV